jgi:Ala-tRNA(Pro) deacylase
MPVQNLRDFLNENGVKYVTISHSPAFTAQEIAALTHIKGQDMAKTVMVKLDDEMAMAVLPASYHVDLEMLEAATGARHAAIATEQEFKGRFPQCEAGAMPPFGNLYGMDVYVDSELTEDEEIAFNAGSHTELVRLAYNDFARLVRPQVMSFHAVPVAV